MKRSTRSKLAPLLMLACATAGVLAGSKTFSINDDILAFPQVSLPFTLRVLGDDVDSILLVSFEWSTPMNLSSSPTHKHC